MQDAPADAEAAQGEEAQGAQAQSPSMRRGHARGVTHPPNVAVPYIRRIQMRELPTDVHRLDFVHSPSGRAMCWELARHSSDQFVEAGLSGAHDIFFFGTTLRVYFPIRDMYYVVRTFRDEGALTLATILQCVERAAASSVSFYLQRELGVEAVTLADISDALRAVAVCRLLIRRTGGANHVYVRLTGVIKYSVSRKPAVR